jgi:cell surface protein SprA
MCIRDSNYALRNETGSFTMSTFTLGSAFGGSRGAKRAFEEFSANRRIISERLRNANPEYGQGEGFRPTQVRSELPGVDGYWNGYLGSQQDVLISSFLSAYGPGKAEKIPLTPFLNIPLPNWNVTYNGLTNLDFFKERFRTVTLRHGYTSTYNTSYLLNLNALDPDRNGFSTVSLIRDTTAWVLGGQRGVDTLSARDYQSIYNIQNITINENFSPLIGINIAWKNDINTAFDFKRRRMVALNVGAMQVNEMRSTDLTVNISWRRDRGLDPITLFGKSFELKNTITYRFEVTVRNTRTENRYLDATRPPEPTAGNLNMTFKPSVDYLVNNQLTVRVYIEHTRNNPVLSTSFPTRFTAYGVQVQFRL